jgi:AcrR family transcriptional regulator
VSAGSIEGAGFLRARRPEQKQQRSAAILVAARELALRDGVGSVSLAAIAAEVGMHKSALLKYFGTRDEIFLRLADGEWRDWAADLAAELAGAPPGVAAVAGALSRSITRRALFCQLLLHSTLTLERNVSLDAVRSSKIAAMAATDAAVEAVHGALPDLERQCCFELVGGTALVAGSLWQVAHPPPVVAALYAEHGAAEGFGRLAAGDLEAQVDRFVRIFLAGLRVEGPPRD